MGTTSQCIHNVECIEIEEDSIHNCVTIKIITKKQHYTQPVIAELKFEITAFKSCDAPHIGMVWKERTPE